MKTSMPPSDLPHETPFSIRVERRGQAAFVRINGSCSMAVAGQIGDALTNVVDEETTRLLIVEMSGVDFIESTGLGGLVAGYLRVRRRHGELRVVSPQPQIRELLELTRLNQLFPIYRDVDSALGAPLASR